MNTSLLMILCEEIFTGFIASLIIECVHFSHIKMFDFMVDFFLQTILHEVKALADRCECEVFVVTAILKSAVNMQFAVETAVSYFFIFFYELL